MVDAVHFILQRILQRTLISTIPLYQGGNTTFMICGMLEGDKKGAETKGFAKRSTYPPVVGCAVGGFVTATNWPATDGRTNKTGTVLLVAT